MFELIFFLIIIFGNIFFDICTYLNNFLINNNQLIVNILILIFYAWLNDDLNFDDNQDLDEDDEDDEDSEF